MLRGKHVVLRSFEREDVARQHALMANVDLVLPAYSGWEPQSQAGAGKWFDKHLEMPGERGGFAIEVDGTFVGFINIHPWSVSPRSGAASFGMAVLHPRSVVNG